MSDFADIAVLTFAVSSMLAVGLGHTLAEIVGPLGSASNVARAVAANFVLVPLLGLAIVDVLPLEPPLAVGLFLVATAAGAPFLVKLTQAAQSDVARSAALLVLLLPITVVYMPIVVPLALPRASVRPGAIAMPLGLTMLLPLALGLLVRAQAQKFAARLLSLLSPVSTVALVLLIAATVLANVSAIVAVFRTGAVLAALVLIGGAFAIGYLLGGRDREARAVLGLGTGQRNIAAATVVAAEAIGRSDTLSMVIISSLAGFAVLFPLAAVMRRRAMSRSGT
jgi:BASS family bile acid:Na+ symporter